MKPSNIRTTTRSISPKKQFMTTIEITALLPTFQGLIMGLVLKSWRRLPAWLRTWVSPEDMFNEAYANTFYTFEKGYYDGRSAYCTFIHHVVENNLKRQASRYLCRKRGALQTENAFERLPESTNEPLYCSSPSPIKFVNASHTFQALLLRASVPLQNQLRSWLTERIPSRINGDQPEIRELRTLCKELGLGYDDFALVLHITRTGPLFIGIHD